MNYDERKAAANFIVTIAGNSGVDNAMEIFKQIERVHGSNFILGLINDAYGFNTNQKNSRKEVILYSVTITEAGSIEGVPLRAICAIKELRNMDGTGLKESKEAVEQVTHRPWNSHEGDHFIGQPYTLKSMFSYQVAKDFKDKMNSFGYKVDITPFSLKEIYD